MEKVRRIVFIGTYAKNTLHQLYDTGLLHATSLCAEEVVCYKDKTTHGFIRDSEKKYGFGNNVELRSVRTYAPKNKYLYVLGMVLSGAKSVLLFCITRRTDIVVYAYNNFFAIHLINSLNKILHRRVIISCHGEMELLINNVQGAVANINRVVLKDFFLKSKIDQNLKFIVLGDSMLKNVKPYVATSNFEHFYSIECPCYMHETPKLKPENNTRIKLGVLGTLSPIKGLDDMIAFICKLKERNIDYFFSVIGGVSTGNKRYSEKFDNLGVNILGGSLPRETFEKEISKLDYVVFFYPHDSYKLIASGTLLDAIALNKPVIALRNDYFEYILNKTKHPSKLCESIDEMVDYIVSGEAEHLYDMDFEASKTYFSPEFISKQLQLVIDSFI